MKIAKFEPSFSGAIVVENAKGERLYEQQIKDLKEANEFLERYGNSAEQWTPFRATLVPARTDTTENFIQDLFLPNYFRVSNKVNDVIAEILSLIVDLATLPIRLLTAPFRIIYSKITTPVTHPLVQFIHEYAAKSLPVGTTALRIKVIYFANQVERPVKDAKGVEIQWGNKYDGTYVRDVTINQVAHLKNDDKLTTIKKQFVKEADGWVEDKKFEYTDRRVANLFL